MSVVGSLVVFACLLVGFSFLVYCLLGLVGFWWLRWVWLICLVCLC